MRRCFKTMEWRRRRQYPWVAKADTANARSCAFDASLPGHFACGNGRWKLDGTRSIFVDRRAWRRSGRRGTNAKLFALLLLD
jgi:hypothetical protein